MKPYASTTEEYLQSKGVKPSFQRARIYDRLLARRNHPTVEEIHQDLIRDIPTLSKTTVYNTLKLFHEKNILQLIVIEENENRYDADIAIHGHFRCEKCRKIFDIPLDISQMQTEGLHKFLVKENHIYFKGLCDKCQAK